MSELLIRNGHLIDPASDVDEPRDMLLREGRVAGVEKPGGFADLRNTETLDASGVAATDVHLVSHLWASAKSSKHQPA